MPSSLNLLNYKIENLASEFGSNLKKGLSKKQYSQNLLKYGSNKISKEDNSILKIFLSQFNIFCFLLIFSSLFSLILKEYIDALFIAFFVVLDVSLGFYQEYKSDKTAKLLEKYNSYRCSVLRDGHKYIIDHESLVPGDIIELKPGDIIPADCKLIDSNDLFINESVISGESKPVFKSLHQTRGADPVLISGTAVIKGFATAIVVYTGVNSRIGNISKLSTATSSESIYEKEAKKLSNFILKLVSVSLTIAVIFNYFFNFDFLPKFLLFSIALAVTVIPEALPLVITFSLSNGALRLYKNKVLVKRLTAIEDLGGIDVLCTDKTGTLTENKLIVSDYINFDSENFLRIAYFSINNKGGVDSFDQAIIDYTNLNVKYKELSEIPFDPSRKRSSKLIEYKGEKLLIVKGAFEIISQFDHITSDDRAKLLKFNKDHGDRGNRVLLFGFAKLKKDIFDESDEKNLQICGAIAFEDPIRFSTFEAINKAKDLNLEVKILTGDSKEVSYYVAEKIGLINSISEVVSSHDLSKLKGEALREAIYKAKVFCRVSPEDKYEIIKTLQLKHQVGYMGDGINDAPALKLANVGIAVSNSSDIAKSSADIILTNKSLNVLVSGILEGRKIFYNVTKYIKITISSNFGNYFAMLTSTFFVNYLPLAPIQILLLNFVSDVPLMAVSSDNVDWVDLKTPSKSNFNRLMSITMIMGSISTIFDFIIFFYFRSYGQDILQSSWFLCSVLTEIAIIFSLRTPLFFFKSTKPSFLLSFVATLTAVGAIAAVFHTGANKILGFTPLNLSLTLTVLSITLTYFILSEIIKVILHKVGWLN